MTDSATLSRPQASHIWARAAEEHYVEPEWCARRLFEVEHFVGGIWDPACGFGTIPHAARAAGLIADASDIADRGYGYRLDFMTSSAIADNIVTNPPFNIAPKFTQHALKLATRKVAIIFPVARLNAAHWLQETPLTQVWLLTPRPSMPPGHVIASGEKPGGGKMDFCWLVFERGKGRSAGLRSDIGWLRRDGDKQELEEER